MKSSAERVEGRGPVNGNLQGQNTLRAQRRDGVQSELVRVRQAARRDKTWRFTSLLHHIYNPNTLREAYFGLNSDAAPGVDGETRQSYGRDLEGRPVLPGQKNAYEKPTRNTNCAKATTVAAARVRETADMSRLGLGVSVLVLMVQIVLGQWRRIDNVIHGFVEAPGASGVGVRAFHER